MFVESDEGTWKSCNFSGYDGCYMSTMKYLTTTMLWNGTKMYILAILKSAG